MQRSTISDVAPFLVLTDLGETTPPQTLAAGNADRRTDILNVAAGVSAKMGALTVTNGFVAPIRTGSDRGFDFEYNLQVQRSF